VLDEPIFNTISEYVHAYALMEELKKAACKVKRHAGIFFSSDWLQGKGPLPARLLMFIFADLAWALWTTRNKMTIEKNFSKTPTDVIYVALSLMQQWSILRVKESLQG
jgi:hypothetical protein